MSNIESDLLLLTINLSQLKNKESIIELFIEGLSAILPKYKFNWHAVADSNSLGFHRVSTQEKTYGFIQTDQFLINDPLLYPLFQNAIQLLAIIIERVEQNKLLNHHKIHLQRLVDQQTKELVCIQEELRASNDELKVANEELLEANRSLIESNRILFGEIKMKEAMEEKLAESEAKFRSIIHSSPNGIYLYEQNSMGQLIFSGANPSADRIIGIDHSILLGKTIEEAFPNLAHTFVPTLYADIATGKKETSTFEIEYEDARAKGFFNVVVYQIIKNAVAVEFIEISERKRAECLLRENERFLNESQRVSGIGSYTLDITKGIWKGSPMLDDIFESYRDEDHSVKGWLNLIHPDDREMMENYFTREVLAEKRRFDKQYRIQSLLSNKIKWLHGIGELEMDPSGNPVKMIGTIQDITFKVEAEEKLRVLTRAIDQSPNSIVITNIRAEITYVNPVIERLSGYTKEELIGQNPHIFSSGKTPKEKYEELWKTITSGSSWMGEFENRKKSGELYWESAIISPVFNPEGKITHYFAIREDITEKKKTQQELILAKEKAEESDRLKSAFLANMSHEIRTPMNSIMGFASLLPDEESKELMARYAQIILQNSEQLVHIIDDIVLYSRLQTRLLSNSPKEFKLFDLLHDVKQSFDLPEYKYGIELLVDIAIPGSFPIKTDYEKLRQIFTNLVSNAFKYTKSGSITIGAKSSGQQITFFVKDTGIGIPPTEYEKVFDRFYRGSNVNKSSIGGTGLGLSIVKELIDLLGGRIWIESKLEKGTTFWFTVDTIM